jgi:hypothetical protein
MLPLEKHHIADLFVVIDDLLPTAPVTVGRPSILTDAEIITILIWSALDGRQKTIKDIWRFAHRHLAEEFPRQPSYNAFLDHCHRVAPPMYELLQHLLCTENPIKIADSTMLPVCKLHRVSQHKVAKSVAAFGKNHQGWHYGFKLHLSMTLHKELSAVVLTPANVYDGQVSEILFNTRTKIGIGDSHYGASVMRDILWERSHTIIIAPPHYKQRKKIATFAQLFLLNQRSKIESVFDILKEHMHLVSSFPRSVRGYMIHYVRILLGYQIMVLSRVE